MSGRFGALLRVPPVAGRGFPSRLRLPLILPPYLWISRAMMRDLLQSVRRSSGGLLRGAAWHTAAIMLVLGWLGADRPADAQDAVARPNIVLILIDDMGWRDLSCYGSTFHKTPNIDRLASQGMRFTDAYAACAVCSPTRASLLTGQYPARLHLTDYLSGRPPQNAKLQVPDWTPYLKPEVETLASVLKRVNYVTALIGKWHLGGSSEFGAPPEAIDSVPERRGFDVNIAGSHYGQPADYFYPYERPAPGGKKYGFPNPLDGQEGDYLTDRLTLEAERFIEQNRERPFFLYLPHYAVHTSIGDRLQGKPETVAKYQAEANPKAPQHNPEYAAMVENPGRQHRPAAQEARRPQADRAHGRDLHVRQRRLSQGDHAAAAAGRQKFGIRRGACACRSSYVGRATSSREAFAQRRSSVLTCLRPAVNWLRPSRTPRKRSTA